MSLSTSVKFALLAAVGLATGGSLAAATSSGRHAPAQPETRATLAVPHASVTIDGETDDPAWTQSGRTGAFRAQDGTEARPYSDARFVWGDDQLYLMLYAADEDIVAPVTEADGPIWTGDSFHLVFKTPAGERTFDVSPLGAVTDATRREDGKLDYRWQSGARVAHDADGTVNSPGDQDEEWVLEIAIPLRALGLEPRAGQRVEVTFSRCDTPLGAKRTCGSWGGELELEGAARTAAL